MPSASLSLGVAAALGPALIAEIAVAAENAGFASLWVNDTPHGDALTALSAAAGATDGLRLATGVLPVDRRSPDEIADAVAEADLPPERLTLGIGSGALRRGALDAVEGALATLRRRTAARVLVGALGPRMRELGARAADGVLLSWLPPLTAGEQCRQARGVRPEAHVALYVRTALDDAGGERMRHEAAQYASYPNYAANFARLGVDVADTVIPGVGNDPAADVAAYRSAVDEVVLRAMVAEDTAAAYRAFITRAAELAR